MVDFVKILVAKEHVPSDILSNEYLNFTRPINEDTGELKKRTKYREADYKNLRFKHYDNGILLLSGSLHKYYNHGIHNYDNFTKSKLDEALNDIEKRFRISLSKSKIRSIEFGLNITPPLKSNKIIKNILIHSREPFKYYSIKGSEYKQSIHQRYIIKAYDKKLMYHNKTYLDNNSKLQKHKINNEIFRFELKFNKMLDLNVLGIHTLSDLKSTNRLRTALELVLESWNRIIFYDPTISKKYLTEYIKSVKLNQWQNPNYWSELPRQRRLEQKRALEKLVSVYSENIKTTVFKKLKIEIAELFHNLTTDKKDNSLQINPKCKEGNSLQINTSNIGEILCSHFSISDLITEYHQIAV